MGATGPCGYKNVVVAPVTAVAVTVVAESNAVASAMAVAAVKVAAAKMMEEKVVEKKGQWCSDGRGGGIIKSSSNKTGSERTDSSDSGHDSSASSQQ